MNKFSEQLKEAGQPWWDQAVNHRFVRELCAGQVENAVMSRYLVQDHRFIDNFLILLGAAMSNADLFESRVVLGRFIGMISGDENDYFLRSFQALGVSERTRAEQPDGASTKGLNAIMLEAAASGSYAAAISVLAVAEGVYLEWGQAAPKPHPENFVYREWITLHDNDYFAGFVGFLRRELDRVGPSRAEQCRDYFCRTVKLEKEFFDEAYSPSV